jgi:hypothetical protein
VPHDTVLTRAADAGGGCSSARGLGRKAVVSLTTSVEHLHYTRRSGGMRVLGGAEDSEVSLIVVMVADLIDILYLWVVNW